MVIVNSALVTPSASIAADVGAMEIIRTELTVTLAELEVAVPPFESVTVTETE